MKSKKVYIEKRRFRISVGREEILKILGRKCISCGSEERLHIHHKVPHWLWQYFSETDKGIFSLKYLDNYQVVCYRCHQKRHRFLNRILVIGFRWHCLFKIRWRPPSHKTVLTYDVVVDDKSWTIGTLAPSDLGLFSDAEKL